MTGVAPGGAGDVAAPGHGEQPGRVPGARLRRASRTAGIAGAPHRRLARETDGTVYGSGCSAQMILPFGV
ncbi:hypothetical protein Shyhy01_56390 [Streptomyces hygroscopicus subsp. hygroscopicus]|nr:hypothetical protein Shyhy01_56390 [Streptomyces hygroscopicus subsp. hygroscopicus]